MVLRNTDTTMSYTRLLNLSLKYTTNSAVSLRNKCDTQNLWHVNVISCKIKNIYICRFQMTLTQNLLWRIQHFYISRSAYTLSVFWFLSLGKENPYSSIIGRMFWITRHSNGRFNYVEILRWLNSRTSKVGEPKVTRVPKVAQPSKVQLI